MKRRRDVDDAGSLLPEEPEDLIEAQTHDEAKPAKSTGPRRTTTPPTPEAYAIGTEVRYKGGSRADWLKKGEILVIWGYLVNPTHRAEAPSFRYAVAAQRGAARRRAQVAVQYVESLAAKAATGKKGRTR